MDSLHSKRSSGSQELDQRIEQLCDAVKRAGASMAAVSAAFAEMAGVISRAMRPLSRPVWFYAPPAKRMAIIKARPGRRWRNREARW